MPPTLLYSLAWERSVVQSNSSVDVNGYAFTQGMSLDEFLHWENQRVIIGIVMAVVLGVLLWDYFIQLPNEIMVYAKGFDALRKAPAAWCFIMLRYSGFIAAFPALWFTALPTGNCQASVVVSQLGVILTVVASGALFCLRFFALLDKGLSLKIFIGALYLIMVASYIAVGSGYRALTGPPIPLGSNCILLPLRSWAPLAYASSVVFDTAILVGTLVRVFSDTTHHSRVGKVLYRDSLTYFLIATVSNVAILIIYGMSDPGLDTVKPAALPFATLMTVTMGTRVYLNLKTCNSSGTDGWTPQSA